MFSFIRIPMVIVCLHRNRNPFILFPKETTSGTLSIHNFPDTSKAWFPLSPFYFLFYFIKICSLLPQKSKENIIWGWIYFVVLKTSYICPSIQCEAYEKNYLNAFIFSAALFFLIGYPLASTITKTLQLLSLRSHGTSWKLPLFLNSVVLPDIVHLSSLSLFLLSFVCFCHNPAFRAVIICLPKTLQRRYYLNLYP